ncbi:hypothetical protein D3H55_15850 [Bacillus salacetis]|uniref:YqhG family protein n=1 Tax=Bacillus salacetis TaxID=2315464 RepID=A0A3A1QWG7_9BACI|nr:YqhG family protein [Bacillus salacetis]RIW31079.1 hypothetical protein D3H55_15850 [Bacillus salacetis]
MQQAEIHQFLERYFTANDCGIVENHPGYMNVQLTIDMDKELMNRPFYWHYLEKTGGIPNPMRLCLITDQEKAPENLKGEVLHFGSPRLHQIFSSARRLASYTRLFESKAAVPGRQTPLQPWLGLNIKISYQCDLKKDLLKSIGLNLINGMMKEEFHRELMERRLTPKIPDFSFTLTPIIKPKSGIARIKSVIEKEVHSQPTEWAESARKRWKEDLDLLDQFYDGMEELPESYFVEKQALAEQYEPKINVEIINGGIFYLSP